MPYYDKKQGILLYKDDACRNCFYLMQCNVFSDLTIDQRDSQYQEQHIVKPGEAKGRPGYRECHGFVEYVAPNEKPDPTPDFGRYTTPEQIELRAKWLGQHPNAR